MAMYNENFCCGDHYLGRLGFKKHVRRDHSSCGVSSVATVLNLDLELEPAIIVQSLLLRYTLPCCLL